MTIPAGGAKTSPRPVVLFVLGMARSGTSALTRVLSLCGGSLPANLVSGDTGNPTGYWEPWEAVSLNEEILRRHRSNFYDPSLRFQEEGSFEAYEKRAYTSLIRAFLGDLQSLPLVIIKDPRITTLFEIWQEAARQAGFDVGAVISVRPPGEVIASLSARDGTSPQLTGALWLKYNLLAESKTRAVPRVFVEYANLIEDWRREVTRISAALGVDLDTRYESAVQAFLAPGLQQERHKEGVTDCFGSEWMSTVYAVLSAAARDIPCDERALDQVYEAYRVSEHYFRTAFEDFRDHFNGLAGRPLVRKLYNAFAATPHVNRALTRPFGAKMLRRIRLR